MFLLVIVLMLGYFVTIGSQRLASQVFGGCDCTVGGPICVVRSGSLYRYLSHCANPGIHLLPILMRSSSTIVRWFLGFVVFVIVLEVCARVDDVVSYGAPFWGTYNDEILLQRDSIGKWGKPGARYAKWQLNSLGYRGPELRSGSVRIITMGASETFGLYEAPGEEYPRQLERDLNSWAGKDLFQVVNVAFAGETLPTSILRVPQIVEQIHPSYALIYPDLSSYIWMSLRPFASNVPAQGASGPGPKFESRLSGRVENLLKADIAYCHPGSSCGKSPCGGR